MVLSNNAQQKSRRIGSRHRSTGSTTIAPHDGACDLARAMPLRKKD
jgi:hypothetical protein